MNKIRIKVLNDYSAAPGPRLIQEGNDSGEKFRIEILLPTIKSAITLNKKLEVDLDGTAGYGTSFLEEAFGGLIRINTIKYEDITKVLEIVSNEEPWLVEDIREYLLDAKKSFDNENVKK